MIREALRNMGKAKLIGKGPNCLVPEEGRDERQAKGSKGSKGGRPALTRHTGFSQFKKPTLNLRWAVIASAQGKVTIGLNKNTAY